MLHKTKLNPSENCHYLEPPLNVEVLIVQIHRVFFNVNHENVENFVMAFDRTLAGCDVRNGWRRQGQRVPQEAFGPGKYDSGCQLGWDDVRGGPSRTRQHLGGGEGGHVSVNRGGGLYCEKHSVETPHGSRASKSDVADVETP
jgi:hypothetical protein